MRIFVTGGSGFIGGHVIERLVTQGHEVTAMARSERSAGIVEGFGARAVQCELNCVKEEHVNGVDAVVHCAAFVEEWGTREQFVSLNVEGTKQLLEVTARAGVSRFIHIGTEAAVFDGSPLIDIDESAPYPSRHKFLYSETKADAERAVLAANTEAFCTISIRPRFVWGPRDQTILPAIIGMADRWSWIDGGRAETSTTHVHNLVLAVELALERGRGGEAYFVADEERSTLREFLSALARTEGVELKGGNIPRSLARGAAAFLEGLYRLVSAKSAPPLTRLSAAMMSTTVTVRTDKAAEALGYKAEVSVAEGLRQLRDAD